MNLRNIIFGLLLAALSALAYPVDLITTKFGQIEFKRGRAVLGPNELNRHEAFSGYKNVDLFLIDQWSVSPQSTNARDIVLLKVLADDIKTSKAQQGYVVLDLRGSAPNFSNTVVVSKDYVWSDNHYVKIRNGVLNFGFYVVDPFNPQQSSGPSDRMQFVYENGGLAENRGPWLGPARPQRYVMPEELERGPCFNVANVPECIAEVERAEAAKKARRPTAGAKAPTTKPAASSASR